MLTLSLKVDKIDNNSSSTVSFSQSDAGADFPLINVFLGIKNI